MINFEKTMIKQLKNILFINFVAMFLLASCSDNQKEVTDMQNRKVKIEKHIDKVICLQPGIAEMFYKFSLEDKLVGRSYFCTFPEQIQALPEVGGVFSLDTNMIKDLNPDLVLASDILAWNHRRFLARNNIPYIIFKDNKKFEDIYAAITLFGQIFNEDEKAQKLITKTKEHLAKIDRTNKPMGKRSYYVVRFGNKNDMTVNENNLIGDLMKKAGLTNIAAKDEDMIYTWNDLKKQDPEYIFINEKNYDNFVISSPYRELSAVKNKKVFVIPSAYTNSLSLENLKAIEEFQKAK